MASWRRIIYGRVGRPEKGRVSDGSSSEAGVSGHAAAEEVRLRARVAELEASLEAARARLARVEEQELRGEERYRLAARATSDAIWDWDLTTDALDWGDGICTLFGYERDEVAPTIEWWYERIHPDDRKRVVFGLHAAIDAGRPSWCDEYRYRRRDGSYAHVVDRGTVVRDAAGKPIRMIGAMLDISERKRAEEDRLALERKFLEAQRVESLGILAGGIAHDFNNLLVGVLGNASLALRKLPPGAPGRELVEQIEIAARRAADLTRQLLTYAGKGRLVVGPTSVNAIVEDMVGLARSSIPKTAFLRVNLAPGLPEIAADAAQLRQLFMTLVINAAEAIGEREGVIAVATGTVEADRAYLADAEYGAELAEGTYVFLEVSDTGCGMDGPTRARIFEPFFTTKFHGRGLGLAAALGIVRGHRGALRVESELGHGATFRVLFPPIGGPAAAPAPGPGTEGPASRRPEGTVLLIDDEPAVRELARRALEEAGFSVVAAEDGRSGVDRFVARPGAFACVVADAGIPRLSGEEVVREVRALRADAPIVLMSGFPEEEGVARAAPGGPAVFLAKPFSPDDLCRSVRRAIEAMEAPGKA
jgi:PAS domain S-box-containing protein